VIRVKFGELVARGFESLIPDGWEKRLIKVESEIHRRRQSSGQADINSVTTSLWVRWLSVNFLDVGVN
jgi:hypothetical protein